MEKIIITNKSQKDTKKDQDFLIHLPLRDGKDKKIFRAEKFDDNLISILRSYINHEDNIFSFPFSSFTEKDITNSKSEFFNRSVLIIAKLPEYINGINVSNISDYKSEDEFLISSANDLKVEKIILKHKHNNTETDITKEKAKEILEELKESRADLDEYFKSKKILVYGSLSVNQKRYQALKERVEKSHKCNRTNSLDTLKKKIKEI